MRRSGITSLSPFSDCATVRCFCLSVLFFIFSDATFSAGGASINADSDRTAEATNHLGRWIWDSRTFDKQTCRLWKSFVIPPGSAVSRAILRITVDNGYRLFLDGREIGRGSDWRTMTVYDVTWLLNHGTHVLAVEGFNDRLEGGMIFGLEIQRVDQSVMEIVSDNTWRIVPNILADWAGKKSASVEWPQATVVGAIHQHPWENWPVGIVTEPPIRPLVTHFWQAGWFQLSLAASCGLALLVSVWLMTQLSAQSKSQLLLEVERARIARDIHDDLGSRLTELLLLGEVSQSELLEDSPTRGQISQICDKARGLAHAMDEVVWAVNSRRDTLRDFVTYVCKHAQFFLKSTPIRCRLDVEPEIPPVAFDLPVRRNLFLAVKEALNNVAKHSEASEVFLRIHRQEHRIIVAIEDNGKGFDPAWPNGERNGMGNMFQRMGEIGGLCRVESQPGNGCRVEFTVPFDVTAQSRWLKWLRRTPPAGPGVLKDSYPGSDVRASPSVKL